MGITEIAAVAAFIVSCCSVIGFWMHFSDRVTKADAKADNAVIAITSNKLEIERVENDLVEHRVAVAKEYVSKGTLESLESRIVDAINRLGDRLDKILTSAH